MHDIFNIYLRLSFLEKTWKPTEEKLPLALQLNSTQL